MKPCASEAISEPAKKAQFQGALCRAGALARNSKATPRRMRPTSITATGRYSAVRMVPCATGKATSSSPIAITSQVSLASQNGPIEATIRSFSLSSAKGNSTPTPRSKPSSTT